MSSFLVGLFAFPSIKNTMSNSKLIQSLESFWIPVDKSNMEKKEDLAMADFFIKMEIGRNSGTNRRGESCQCPGVCFGICSISVGFTNRLSDSSVKGYLDVNDKLNVARIYFSDELDYRESAFFIDEESIVDLSGAFGSALNGVVLEKGTYTAIAHQGNIRINNMESRYTGYVDVNVRRY